MLTLNNNLRCASLFIKIIDKDTGKPFSECSYAIYSIREGETREPNWEIDQKIATLLSQLDGKGNSGKAAVEFLRETMGGITYFKS